MEEEINAFFDAQVGGGISPYENTVILRGKGLGGIFNGLMKFAAPFVRRLVSTAAPVVKDIGKAAIGEITTAGLNTLADAVHGQPIKEVAAKRFRNVAKRTASAAAQRADRAFQPYIKRQKRDVFHTYEDD